MGLGREGAPSKAKPNLSFGRPVQGDVEDIMRRCRVCLEGMAIITLQLRPRFSRTTDARSLKQHHVLNPCRAASSGGNSPSSLCCRSTAQSRPSPQDPPTPLQAVQNQSICRDAALPLPASCPACGFPLPRRTATRHTWRAAAHWQALDPIESSRHHWHPA